VVKIRLHTENQLPRLPGSTSKVPVVGGLVLGGLVVGGLVVGGCGVVGSYPLSSQAPTCVEDGGRGGHNEQTILTD
jgi:hypothetical protein